MIHKIPKQCRAILSESAYLDAFERLIAERGYTRTSVEAIASEVGLTKAAFLSRFGSKKVALLLLFDRYCAKASAMMQALRPGIPEMASADAAIREFSVTLEQIQLAYFASNRAMQELFLEELTVDDRTRKIFLELVDLMRLVQQHHMQGVPCTDTGAFAAAQIVVSINYNYVLRAMPALPRDHETRHRMTARMAVEALSF